MDPILGELYDNNKEVKILYNKKNRIFFFKCKSSNTNTVQNIVIQFCGRVSYLVSMCNGDTYYNREDCRRQEYNFFLGTFYSCNLRICHYMIF